METLSLLPEAEGNEDKSGEPKPFLPERDCKGHK